MMEEKIVETEEVLENIIPEELEVYLEADNDAVSKIDTVLGDLDKSLEDLICHIS